MGTKIVYNHKAIEKKWREKWEETPVNPRNGKDGNKKTESIPSHWMNDVVSLL